MPVVVGSNSTVYAIKGSVAVKVPRLCSAAESLQAEFKMHVLVYKELLRQRQAEEEDTKQQKHKQQSKQMKDSADPFYAVIPATPYDFISVVGDCVDEKHVCKVLVDENPGISPHPALSMELLKPPSHSDHLLKVRMTSKCFKSLEIMGYNTRSICIYVGKFYGLLMVKMQLNVSQCEFYITKCGVRVLDFAHVAPLEDSSLIMNVFDKEGLKARKDLRQAFIQGFKVGAGAGASKVSSLKMEDD